MTSTLLGVEICQELKDLFSWNPPPLFPAPRRERRASTSTRLPAFFEKHLSDRLLLKHVKCLPSLLRDIAKTVDDAIDTAARDGIKLPPPGRGLLPAEIRQPFLSNLDPEVEDEKAVADYYDKATATYCAPVASTLALHPNTSTLKWCTVIKWSRSGNFTGYAIADGLLQFVSNRVLPVQEVLNTMDENKHRLYLALNKHFPHLATWGFRSLAAGSEDTMLMILNQSDRDPFEWTKCSEPDCKNLQNHKRELDRAAEITPGPDAKFPLWNLKENSRADPPAQSSPEPPQNLQRSTRLNPGVSQATSSMPPPPLPTAPLEVLVSRTDEKGKRKRDTGDEGVKSPKNVPARFILQHAWAQAALEDTTIIVLNSGNHEVVCVRERRTQTLYVSNVFAPSTCTDPGYGKLHVGIYIAAIQDAIDRVKQLPKDDDNSADRGDESKGTDDRHEAGSRGGHRGNGRDRHGDSTRRRGTDQSKTDNGKKGGSGTQGPDKLHDACEIAAHERTMAQANRRSLAFLYLQYGVYDSPVPATFIRSAPSIWPISQHSTPSPSPHIIDSAQLEDCLSIILTSEIGKGGTGVVLGGQLEVEATKGCVPLDIVVKLAFSHDQRDSLRNEYEIYRHLCSKGVVKGIPTVLGFFDDSEGGPSALVMSFSGVSLATEPKPLSFSQQEAALATLKSIHRAGVLHGDIREHNLLIGNAELTIIDFDRSTMCDDQEAMDGECAQLRYILDSGSDSEDE